MENQIEKIGEIIHLYESGAYLQLETLRQIRRELATANYHLTKINIDAYNRWNTLIYNRGNDSVASARVKADFKVPELRESRKIMEAVKNVLSEMNQEISILKNEN
jgi:septation ring formation regulator EzrA